jgi:hypothetical protein
MILHLDTKTIPLPDESIDMIFTDPPYVKDALQTYKFVANEAARLLKPNKFIAVMCGGMALNKIMRWFDDADLRFYWLYQLGMTATGAGIVWMHGNTNVPISTRTKHVLVYSKGKALARTATVGLYWAGGVDKKWHHWGQDIDSHRYYIDCFSREGDLILDPMAGGGTTAKACELLNRRWIVGDNDAEAIEIIKRRLNNVEVEYTDMPLFRPSNKASRATGRQRPA